MIQKYTYSILLILLNALAGANNLHIVSARLVDSLHLQVNLTWNHCWNMDTAPGNHDAVWLFAKSTEDGKVWHPLDFSSISANHTISGDVQTQIKAVQDGKGVFIIPINNYDVLPLQTTIICLAEPLPEKIYTFRIFGLEMVNIPEGPFYLGDSISINSFANSSGKPYKIQSEAAIQNNKIYSLGDYAPDEIIPYAFPKGFQSFYVMKYEISQEQYCDFLNCLNYVQQANRTAIPPSSLPGTLVMSEGSAFRNGLVIKEAGQKNNHPAVYGCDGNRNDICNEAGDGQNRAMNFLSWSDLSSYLDWAGLRPMTELEFEKICRGPKYPVPGEFAWGTPLITDANQVIQDGFSFESVSDPITEGSGLANTGYLGISGPLRCGFAASENTGRHEAGASWTGVMEMSGNLWEICIPAIPSGILFTGENGDGNVDQNGDANVPNWPLSDGNGAGYRGGAWNSGIYDPGQFRDLAVSDRYYAGLKPDLRRNTAGGRGVRTNE